MIINAETLKSLKQINVSADKEKTMSRVKQLWADTLPGTKKKVLATVKTGDATIYRIFRTGAITPRIVLALAGLLNANPFYLTGDSDEDEGYSPEVSEQFLEAKGIDRRSRGKKGAIELPAAAEEVLSDDEAIEETAEAVASNDADAYAELNEDEYVLQIRALFHRAAFSASAQTKLATVAELLFKD